MNSRRLLPQLVLWLFPVIVVAMAVLLLWGLYTVTIGSGGRGFGTLGRILVAPLLVAVVLGFREARRFRAEPAEGIEVTAAQHPALWAEVQQLAQLAQTAPPSRIVIVPEVNAAVTEADGRRELMIGLPLLATFSRGELRSVLAHELGHFAGADILANPITAALLASGAADVQLSWTGSARLTGRDGGYLEVNPLVEQAIAAGSSAWLRSWLAGQGVDVTTSYAVADVPQWLAAVSQMTGPWQGRRDVHLWSTGILALPPLDKATISENKSQLSDKHQHPRLYAAAAAGLAAGRQQPDALWWDAARITGGSIDGRMKIRMRFDLADAPPLELKATLETAPVDSAEDVGTAFAYLIAPKAPVTPPG